MPESVSTRIKAANEALFVRGDLDVVAEFFTPEYSTHFTDGDKKGGHAAVRRVIAAFRRAFTDLQVEVEILVQSEDRVAWQRTLQGTHSGAFGGFPPTGQPIRWRDMVTSRMHKGRIAEEWVVTDLAEHLLLARKR